VISRLVSIMIDTSPVIVNVRLRADCTYAVRLAYPFARKVGVSLLRRTFFGSKQLTWLRLPCKKMCSKSGFADGLRHSRTHDNPQRHEFESP
jgi:hypothetical protein